MAHTPEVEKMIGRVMKRRDCTNSEAITYMLTVATGRLAALWRYDDTLPEGKTSKGVRIPGKRKMAERSAPVGGDGRRKAKEAKVKAAKPKKAVKPKKAATVEAAN